MSEALGTKSIRTGNRCGHDPHRPRFCDVSRRGKGGQPPVIGIINGRLRASFSDHKILSSWQSQNPSGRKRRTEAREAMISLIQYLTAQWMQLETRRCAVPGFGFLQAPDARHLSNKITASKHWGGQKMSVWRVNTIFAEFKKAGYITSKQKKTVKSCGNWNSSPAIRTFTKKFFIELGGERLWRSVQNTGKRKLSVLQQKARVYGETLKGFLSPSWIITPQIAFRLKRASAKPEQYFYPYASKDKTQQAEDLTADPRYRVVFAEIVERLFMEHPPDGPLSNRWSVQEMKDNAKRITLKQLSIH